MTAPRTPAEALKRATDRVAAQRAAARKTSEELAAQRDADQQDQAALEAGPTA
jgi:hypothetical protein